MQRRGSSTVTGDTKKLTVLICTRNGARTIAEAVAGTVADLAAWDPRGAELIVVDNGSTDGTRSLVESASAGANVDVITLSAPIPGKMHAFTLGVHQARSDLVCIIDDDNVVQPGYFRRLYAFLADFPDVGIVGGLNTLDSRVTAPAWFEWAKHFMACTRPMIDQNVTIDGDQREVGDFGWIPGAGMGFRKQPLLDALEAGYQFFNDTQRGPGMRVSGEDIELCLLLQSMGYRFGYDPNMQLRHNLAADRLTQDAFWMLCRTIGAGSLGLDPYYFTTKRPLGPLPLKWTWQWQLLSKLRQLVSSKMPGAVVGESDDEVRFRRRMACHQARGAIRRILAERSRYNAHIQSVASGAWTRYRVR